MEGPLKGYHHETYAFPLAAENPLATRFERGKLRSPREELLWFDRRCFASEDRLLIALRGRIARIPECFEVAENVCLQGFIEGGTLSSRPLSNRHLHQLGRLFEELVAVKADELDIRRNAAADGRSTGTETDSDAETDTDTDSGAFLRGLIRFTEEQVYGENAGRFGTLFDELGVPENALEELKRATVRLAPRPFALIHGDLHRENFIVDPAGDLWTIDWELAAIGDPLYDLATHLHLMRYSQKEEGRVREVWRAAVERVRPGSSDGWEQDLPVLLSYKRAQSVYTDVIRTAVALGSGPKQNWRLLPRAAWRIHLVLKAAAEPLGLPEVPTLRQVMAAYLRWLRAYSGRTDP
ncbi:phosphotransferase family protein [Streptomyces sp. NPDC005279]|uniref:phosphotransferase family protein n=1 Tax=Streptomyces sp. NPDC005279 TaxID=3364712 RepID=UPI003678990C